MMAAETAIDDPCVVFALRRESMYVRRVFSFQRHFPNAPCLAQFRGVHGQSVLMLETGIGSSAMESALRWCLSKPLLENRPYKPRYVVSLGFSGALRQGQRVGDLVLANEVVDEHGHRWQPICPQACGDSALFARGRLLTAEAMVSAPSAKERLGQQFQALAVDMESAVAARLCHEFGVPFVCLRAISDDAKTRLSHHLLDLMNQGRISPSRLVVKLLCHPHLLCELWRLAKQTRLAARKLLMLGSVLSILNR